MKNNLNIVAIVQARMGSTRLPGKVMKTILDKHVILWDIDRVSLSKLIDKIVVAIPFGKQDDVIADTIEEYNSNILISRGSEDDVLDRYYNAAVQTNADVVVRITSDCPLIDPVVVDHVIEQFLNNDCDYCSNSLQRTYPRGLDTEVFSFDALSKAWNESKKDYEREHVTPYIIENPYKFKLLNVSNDIDLSHLRWTLDTKEDFEFIDAVYQRIYLEKQMFFMDDVLDLLDHEPGLIDINKHIEQKKAH
ncbi:MAG: 3-deoxy-manno-octulosonate cytidylyltransferase [Candidatus Methanogaster sp.]|nr:MAG: 3-deoxy-manno-octulosonate cytidylyltransferase [ANME-2 cluster archaeon]